MACLKCGKKIKDEQAFCAGCLKGMEAYPVKRDIYIQLPNRKPEPSHKRFRRKRPMLPPEEELVYLRSRIRLQYLALVLLSLALAVALIGLVMYSDAVEELKRFGTDYSLTG